VITIKIPWSKTRHMLENDFLCDSLKGRVRYFATRYHHAHDEKGRICVLVDNQEVVNMPFQNENKIYTDAYERFEDCDKSLFQVTEEVIQEYHERGDFRPYDFGRSVDAYLGQSIHDSLNSEDLLVKMLAILDRRIGKRTLQKIKITVSAMPEWLQYFYKLRLESENML
jgi:hypothetical protein